MLYLFECGGGGGGGWRGGRKGAVRKLSIRCHNCVIEHPMIIVLDWQQDMCTTGLSQDFPPFFENVFSNSLGAGQRNPPSNAVKFWKIPRNLLGGVFDTRLQAVSMELYKMCLSRLHSWKWYCANVMGTEKNNPKNKEEKRQIVW